MDGPMALGVDVHNVYERTFLFDLSASREKQAGIKLR